MDTKSSRPRVEFPTPKSVGDRPWGQELMIGVVRGHFTFKVLLIKSGNKGGLQYHHKKDEFGYIISGQLLVRFEAETDGVLTEKTLGPSDTFHFPTGAVHQEEALTDCVIVEVSTPYLNDRVRVEEEFGLPPGTGLPSTKPEEVQTL